MLSEARQQVLDLLVLQEFLLIQAENLEGLLLSYKAPLSPKALLCDLGPAPVNVPLLHIVLFSEEVEHFLKALLLGQRSNHLFFWCLRVEITFL